MRRGRGGNGNAGEEVLAAIRFYRTFSVYVSIPLIALGIFTFIFVLIGALYSGGFVRGETYAGIMIALAIIFFAILAVSAGLFFFARVVHVT